MISVIICTYLIDHSGTLHGLAKKPPKSRGINLILYATSSISTDDQVL